MTKIAIEGDIRSPYVVEITVRSEGWGLFRLFLFAPIQAARRSYVVVRERILVERPAAASDTSHSL